MPIRLLNEIAKLQLKAVRMQRTTRTAAGNISPPPQPRCTGVQYESISPSDHRCELKMAAAPALSILVSSLPAALECSSHALSTDDIYPSTRAKFEALRRRIAAVIS